MKVHRDNATVVALAGGLVVLTGVALVIAAVIGSSSGWGVWVAAGLAVTIGLVVLIRVQHTTTIVDGDARVLTIEVRGLVGPPKTETIPFDVIGSVVGRHINLDDEYPEHALMLVLVDGSRRTLAYHMNAERVDTARDEIRALLES